LAGTQQSRGDRHLHLIDETCTEVLPNRCHTTAESDIPAVSRGSSLPQGSMDAFGYEVEGCSPLHDQLRPRVMRQHEYRHVVRGIFSPPPLPGILGPGPAHRSKHVPAENPCANVIETPGSKIIVDSRGPVAVPEHALECPGGERPVVEGGAADAQWIVQAL